MGDGLLRGVLLHQANSAVVMFHIFTSVMNRPKFLDSSLAQNHCLLLCRMLIPRCKWSPILASWEKREVTTLRQLHALHLYLSHPLSEYREHQQFSQAMRTDVCSN